MKIKSVMDGIDSQLPLLICDVDEVVLHFVAPFETYLSERGMYLRKTSFKLGGNIINADTGESLSSLSSSALALQFHEEYVDHQPIIEDAQPVLTALAAQFQIVFLTNVAAELSMRRQSHLAALGLDFPVLQNNGSKAEAVAQLANITTSPTIFIDDLPMHHSMIKSTSPEVFCIHYMADSDFRRIAEVDQKIAEKAEDWQQIKSLCLQKI
ncbi:MAG: hypothetical protein ABJ081_09390 [Hyphomicrobiales bacterium]